MKKETTGTILRVSKQVWLKVNSKPIRTGAMDGATFPHIITAEYTVDGKRYVCRKWVRAGVAVPPTGSAIRISYAEDRPSRGKIELPHSMLTK